MTTEKRGLETGSSAPSGGGATNTLVCVDEAPGTSRSVVLAGTPEPAPKLCKARARVACASGRDVRHVLPLLRTSSEFAPLVTKLPRKTQAVVWRVEREAQELRSHALDQVEMV